MPTPTPPIVLLTCGDPAGIGPEVAALAWAATPAHDQARLRVVADPGMIAAALAERRGLPAVPVTEVTAADPRPSTPGELLVIRPDAAPAAAVAPRAVSAAGGRQAAAAVR
jgi:4-hydroxythreonine-4-phosphate dehydrogenase